MDGLGVLIVEDDLLIAETLRDGVRLSGYRCCGIARDLDQALSLARETRPDLAIIDINLGAPPDGIAVARRLLEIGPIAILFLTGDSRKLDGIDIGHAWMGKPYRVLDMINALTAIHSVANIGPSKRGYRPTSTSYGQSTNAASASARGAIQDLSASVSAPRQVSIYREGDRGRNTSSR
jgi:DNA-binding response OmpR family regulator